VKTENKIDIRNLSWFNMKSFEIRKKTLFWPKMKNVHVYNGIYYA